MKEIRMSSQFKKDFKRYRNDTEKVKALYHIVGYLERGEQKPSQYKSHMLKRELKGIMELSC
jgi:mRNA interferase YafQ